jgi:hypothetical protein
MHVMDYARSHLRCCSQDLPSGAAEQFLPVLLVAVAELVPHCCGRATRLQSELISRCASAVCSVYLASGGRSGSSKQLHEWLCEAIAHPHPFVALIARTTWCGPAHSLCVDKVPIQFVQVLCAVSFGRVRPVEDNGRSASPGSLRLVPAFPS